MSQTPELLKQEIVKYYEICDTDYAFFWKLKSRMAMHYGYWDEKVSNFGESLWRMNEVMAQQAGISEKDLVLDAGCGIGGSAFFVHQKYGSSIHGISLSERHMREANQRSKQMNTEAKVQFSSRDFCDTQFNDASFDVVWGLESVCHAADKNAFLNEAFRILKPGGRLVIGDFFQLQNLDASQNKMMQRWAETWAVPSFEEIQKFRHLLAENQFEDIVIKNITSNIKRSSKRLYRFFIPGLIGNSLLPIFGKRRNRVQQLNVWSTYWQYKSLKKSCWNYYIITAKRK